MEKITVTVEVMLPKEQVWEMFTDPAHITAWCFASSDWHTPRAQNDLRVGGVFLTRMEAVDGSQGFDFEGTYTAVTLGEQYAYVMADGREVMITFSDIDGGTKIVETFDPETENPAEMQRYGWQSILNNFKAYAERVSKKKSTVDSSLLMGQGDGHKPHDDETTGGGDGDAGGSDGVGGE